MNYFEALNAINFGEKLEKKNGLTYVPWADAWAELKKLHPMSFFTIYENESGWPYFTDGNTCWVKTGVTVMIQLPSEGEGPPKYQSLEHIEYLPIMDFRNASIRADKVTSMDINKSIQRSLTKAAARHGCGLYVYRGEDLPEGAEPPTKADNNSPTVKTASTLPPNKKDRKGRMAWFCNTHKITAEEFSNRLKKLQDENVLVPQGAVSAMTDSEFDFLMVRMTEDINKK